MRRAILLMSALALAACEAGEPTADPVVDPAMGGQVAAPETDLSEEEAAALAFQAAWEADAPVTGSDPRTEDEEGPPLWPPRVEGRFEFRDGQVVQLGLNHYALISSGRAEGDPGHAQAGVLAIHYLTRTEEGFRRLDVDPLFIAGGSSGQPPAFELRPGLTPSPAIVIESGSTNQGQTCVVADVVELTPSHPVLRVEDIPLAYEGGEADRNWEGALAPGHLGRDFEVRYSGASDAEVAYVMTDIGVYRPAGAPDLPGC